MGSQAGQLLWELANCLASLLVAEQVCWLANELDFLFFFCGDFPFAGNSWHWDFVQSIMLATYNVNKLCTKQKMCFCFVLFWFFCFFSSSHHSSPGICSTQLHSGSKDVTSKQKGLDTTFDQSLCFSLCLMLVTVDCSHFLVWSKIQLHFID